MEIGSSVNEIPVACLDWETKIDPMMWFEISNIKSQEEGEPFYTIVIKDKHLLIIL